MGGTQIDTLHLMNWQQSHFDVEVIMGNDGPLRAACESAGIPTRVVPMENRFLTPLSDIRAVVALAKYFRTRRPDIVHTHSSKAGLLGRVAARLARTQVIAHTLHVLPYHDKQPTLLRCSLIVLERLLSKITDHFVAVADTLRADFVHHKICRPDMITTIGSGIDFGHFPQDQCAAGRHTRMSLGIDPAAPVVISVANLEPRKRYDVFVNAVAGVVRTHPDARFLIAGTGELRESIVSRIRDAGLETHVMLLGYRSDVPDLLAASDIFVQTSQLEGLSRSLIEAMYAALPVVATDTDGTRELVQSGFNGLIIPEGDANALTSALTALLEDPGLRKAMGSAGKAVVGERWSVEAMGHGHDVLYEQLLTPKVPARLE